MVVVVSPVVRAAAVCLSVVNPVETSSTPTYTATLPPEQSPQLLSSVIHTHTQPTWGSFFGGWPSL
jgi:hypothetical protein